MANDKDQTKINHCAQIKVIFLPQNTFEQTILNGPATAMHRRRDLIYLTANEFLWPKLSKHFLFF